MTSESAIAFLLFIMVMQKNIELGITKKEYGDSIHFFIMIFLVALVGDFLWRMFLHFTG